MAEIKEEVLIDIKLDQDEGQFKKLADLKGVINGLKEQEKQLAQDRKNGTITLKEYNSEIVRIEALNKKAKASYNEVQRSVTGLKNPLTEINESLKKQTALMGGATPALDKMTGGAASAAQGFLGMAKGAMAFIATPIGAVVTALGLAIGALTAYLKGSEEGQDKLAKVMAVGKVVFDSVLVVVEKLGEALFGIGEVIASGVGSVIDFFAPKVGKMLSDAVKAGTDIANLLDLIEANENELIVKRAETSRRVSELREKAIQSEGAQKRAFVEEAIQLEKKLAAEELRQANLKLSHFNREAKASGALTEEQKKQRAELTAKVIEAEAQAFDATRRFQKELEKLKDDELKTDSERLKLKGEQEALARAERHAGSLEADEIELADLTTRQETELTLRTSFEQGISNALMSFRNQNASNKIAKDKIIVESEYAKNQQLQSLQNQALAFGNQIAGRSRALMTGLTLISTYFAAQKAFESQFLPIPTPGSPVRGAIAAGIAIASGLFRVAQINQVGSFYEGGFGYTGSGNPRQESRALGIKPYTYHKDEYITPSRILNTPEGSYHVGQLEAMRTGKKSFESGGFSGGGGMSQSQFNALLDKINTVQSVLVVEKFEEVQGRRIEVRERATF